MRRTFFVEIEGNKHEVSVVNIEGAKYSVLVNGKEITAVLSSKEARRTGFGSSSLVKKSGEVISPYAGLVTKVLFKEGDSIKEGELICTIEAMKMENQVTAPCSGKIVELQAIEGAEVKKGVRLCKID